MLLILPAVAGITVQSWARNPQVFLPSGHSDSVFSVAFSPGNRLLASGSVDGTTRLRDVAGGRELVRLVALETGGWIRMTPEGYYSSSHLDDRFLNVPTGAGLLEVEGIENWRAKYNRPDVVEAILGSFLPVPRIPQSAPSTAAAQTKSRQRQTIERKAEPGPAIAIPVSVLGEVTETQKQIV